MSTKLTLTIEKEVIDVAKQYAKQSGQSLSALVENYFKLITADQMVVSPNELSPRVQKLRGIIKVEEGIDMGQILEEELVKKYGR